MSDGPYTRFIVLNAGRTGSNMLVHTLNSHPRVKCFREIFNMRPGYVDYEMDGYDGSNPDDVALRDRDFPRFLAERIFCDHSPSVRAVGFKLGYHHFWAHAELLQSLVADGALHVVHLRRRNLLRTLVSSKLAKQTGVWLEVDRTLYFRGKLNRRSLVRGVIHPLRAVRILRKRLATPVPAPGSRTVALSDSECRAFFYQNRAEASYYDGLFNHHPLMTVWYEDIAQARDAALGKVQTFLGVERAPLAVTLRRQNPEPLRELVANYDELRDALAGTPHAVFFDEDN